jgi:type II secretory pathway pseudopilin PulG
MTPKRAAAQRGFTVLELLVSVALLVTIGLITLAVVQYLVRAVDGRASGVGGAVAVEQLLGTMRGDAATAYAVFVPERDVFGAYNAPAPPAPAPTGSGAPHEVDFYARTGGGAEVWWAYRYDATTQTLQRYDYDPVTHAVGVADRQTGSVTTGESYPAVAGVRSFSVQRLEASELASTASAYGPLVAGLLPVAGQTPPPEPMGFVPASGVPRDDLYGGNAGVEIRAVTAHGSRTLHLTTGSLPSGFTIHEAPSIRAFVYRIDVMHRFWFGLAQITHAQIFEQLQYSYNATASNPTWKVWCDYELYGHGIAGLRLNDPQAQYDPKAFNESTAGIFYTSTHDGFAGLGPSHCNDRVPSPNATYAPVPTATSPDVVDTPPPCFYAGECWPEQAPANWAPPSPWPSATPPPAWCSGHEASPLCSGTAASPSG